MKNEKSHHGAVVRESEAEELILQSCFSFHSFSFLFSLFFCFISQSCFFITFQSQNFIVFSIVIQVETFSLTFETEECWNIEMATAEPHVKATIVICLLSPQPTTPPHPSLLQLLTKFNPTLVFDRSLLPHPLFLSKHVLSGFLGFLSTVICVCFYIAPLHVLCYYFSSHRFPVKFYQILKWNFAFRDELFKT